MAYNGPPVSFVARGMSVVKIINRRLSKFTEFGANLAMKFTGCWVLCFIYQKSHQWLLIILISNYIYNYHFHIQDIY